MNSWWVYWINDRRNNLIWHKSLTIYVCFLWLWWWKQFHTLYFPRWLYCTRETRNNKVCNANWNIGRTTYQRSYDIHLIFILQSNCLVLCDTVASFRECDSWVMTWYVETILLFVLVADWKCSWICGKFLQTSSPLMVPSMKEGTSFHRHPMGNSLRKWVQILQTSPSGWSKSWFLKQKLCPKWLNISSKFRGRGYWSNACLRWDKLHHYFPERWSSSILLVGLGHSSL